jgi:hypothetical protein
MNGDGFGRADPRSEPRGIPELGCGAFAQENDNAILFVLIENVGRLEDALSGRDATRPVDGNTHESRFRLVHQARGSSCTP